MIVGMDLSKRSSAIVCVDLDGNLKGFELISSKELEDSELIHYQWQRIKYFVEDLTELPLHRGGIAIEGLSFNSVGTGKDLLAGLQWYVRTRLMCEFPSVPVGVIPPQSWYSYIVSKDERRALLLSNEKDKRKKAVVNKLPWEVKVRFEEYVRKLGVKKEALYDLADSWGIAQYRLSLEGN